MTRKNRSLATAIICSLFIASTAWGAAETLKNEPLVIYDASGYGIAGPLHEHLTVYSSGLTSYSSLGPAAIGVASESNEEADFTLVPAARVAQLVEALLRADAMTLGDLPDTGSDLPMKTVTVFGGPGHDAEHNTFSFYDPNDPRVADIVAALEGFMFEAFGESTVSTIDPRPEQLRTPLAALMTLRYGQGGLLPGIDLGLRFVDVPADSRCPVDVTCIWPGEIEVVVNIWSQGTDQGEFLLTYSAGVGSSVIVAGGYEVQLLGVRPEPRSDDPITLDEYRILLKITSH